MAAWATRCCRCARAFRLHQRIMLIRGVGGTLAIVCANARCVSVREDALLSQQQYRPERSAV